MAVMKRMMIAAAAAILLASCQTYSESPDLAFPEGTSLEDTVIWVGAASDPLGLSSVVASNLGSFGFRTAIVPSMEDVEDYLSASSTGSAFAISQHLLATNSHVVGAAETVAISIDGDEVEAEVVRNEPDADVALLRVEDPLPYAFVLGSDVPKGTHVSILGYPLPWIMGDECKLTDGIVSAETGLGGSVLRTQISAEIQPGNSGGPVFTDGFAVIGMATEKLSDFFTMAEAGVVPQSVNYAVKSDIIRYIAGDLFAEDDQAEPVDSMDEAEQAVFLVKSEESAGDAVNDIYIELSYIYGYEETSMSSYYYADPLAATLHTLPDGEAFDSLTREKTYNEDAYESAYWLSYDIFRAWAAKALPRSNTGETEHP